MIEAVPSTVEIAAGSQARTRFERGRDIYNYRCYFCHGYGGDGQTLAATYLEPRPRDFTATPLAGLSRERMIISVTHGRADTAMKSFKGLLTAQEIEDVVDFIRQAFMGETRLNTRYHTAGNGWPDHEQRFAIAYPFAKGEIPIDTPVESLTPEQRKGRELFMASCITCHDRAKVEEEGELWDARATSYPRGGYSHRQPDAISGATPYSVHERAPQIAGLTLQEQQGETLFQKNCAFCHAADGTGKNWIGSFIEPNARNLTDPETMSGVTPQWLKQVITDGLPGTTMSAWRSVLRESEIDAIVAYVMKAFIPSATEADEATSKNRD